MSEQASALPISLGIGSTTATRRRTLAILLMVLIATIFWVDSRYPALMKRYHAGTHVTAKGALTFGSVYQVDRSMPLATRVWRDHRQLAGRQSRWHDLLVSLRTRRAHLSRHAAAPPHEISLAQHALWRGRRSAAGGL